MVERLELCSNLRNSDRSKILPSLMTAAKFARTAVNPFCLPEPRLPTGSSSATARLGGPEHIAALRKAGQMRFSAYERNRAPEYCSQPAKLETRHTKAL